ncbi:MAG: helix-turn-helix domain-containing protein [bacterium]|nr:helix-turn-helix domain-containing protein [bacterium]
MKVILNELMFQKGLDGVQIAKELNIHSSTVYRWLEKTQIRKPKMRIRTWKQKLFPS